MLILKKILNNTLNKFNVKMKPMENVIEKADYTFKLTEDQKLLKRLT